MGEQVRVQLKKAHEPDSSLQPAPAHRAAAQALDGAAYTVAEPRFGHSFADVHVLDDSMQPASQAPSSADAALVTHAATPVVQRWPEWLDKLLGSGDDAGAAPPVVDAGVPTDASLPGGTPQPVAAPAVDSAPSNVIELPETVIYGDAGAGGFDILADGGVAAGKAPKNITLPEELQKGLQSGWDKSFPGGKSQEQGGLLLQNPDGSYEWKAGAPGNSGSFTPNYGDKGATQNITGVGHTHPYDASEGGARDVTFSGGDLASMVVSPEQMQIVQSGDSQFVATRSAEFDKRVAGLDDAGKAALMAQIEAEYDKVLSSTKGPLKKRAEAATKAVTTKYDIPYYAGKGGKLNKQ